MKFRSGNAKRASGDSANRPTPQNSSSSTSTSSSGSYSSCDSLSEEERRTTKAKAREFKARWQARFVKGRTRADWTKEANVAMEKRQKGSRADYVRLDRVWSNLEHRFLLQRSREDTETGKFEHYAFNVRRKFDFDNKHIGTCLDIISKPLKAALLHVMGEVQSLSLEEESPSIDPNAVFLFLEELRAHRKDLKRQSNHGKDREKALEAKHLKVLVQYLDTDYDETKRSLCPLLQNNKITFDLLWALFKSNETVYAPTYNAQGEPRAFKLEYANLEHSVIKGEFFSIEGRYLEFDGKAFGMGRAEVTIDAFKGPRKITSLNCYPLKYHPDHKRLRMEMIERGRKFVALDGMQYRIQKGIAFYKKNQDIIKINIDGRVVIDPATFRRINPNYPVSTLKPEDKDMLMIPESDDDSKSGSDEEDEYHTGQFDHGKKKKKRKPKQKLVKDEKTDTYHTVDVPVDQDGNVIQREDVEEIRTQNEPGKPDFTEEDYLIASPVALGFSFGEKLWLEFAVSGLQIINWDESAFDSLVLPQDQKEVVKSLVEFHERNAKENIDDIIQGKGLGLVAVLHGPPGTGKTLTAESIAEMVKRPLYMVSVGELGTRADRLEKNLAEILDIAHTWRAVLLIDEADVFLEQRQPQDVGRNALVSIFLRMLEYFQGILFLTTNRVATFDEAFQSRIHIGLRYGKLDVKTRKAVWEGFIGRVRALPDVRVAEFTEEDYTKLSNFEIKNSVRTAQSLALTQEETLSMKHLLQVLFVGNVFAKDLKGPGYEEALKFYM